jgi:hypothetical protein
MPDPAELLEKLYAAGFDIQSFDRFPRSIGVSKGECIALLEPHGDTGLRVLGRPGWKIDDAIGVLTAHCGRRVFQWKNHFVEATPERIKMLEEFERELAQGLGE